MLPCKKTTMNQDTRLRSGLLQMACVVFAVVFVVGILAVFAFGAGKTLEGDALQYLTIGQSLADGNGYRSPESSWPTAPALDRMPFWPLMIAAGLKSMPWLKPELVAQLCGVVCLAATGAFFFVLCRRLGIRVWLSVLGGLGAGLSPVMLVLSLTVFSEPAFVMLLAMGLAMLFGSWRERYIGALCLGLAMLVRSNFLLIAPIALALAMLTASGREFVLRQWGWQRTAGLLFLMMLPLSIWVGRNAMVSGRFPLISTIEGETFYGANNDVVANQVDYWGSWVMPDLIPGETPKLQLTKQLPSDLALNDYYRDRGRAWVAAHKAEMPRLLLGKLVRSFIPMPWKPVLGTYLAFAYRLMLDIGLLLLLRYWWPTAPRLYLVMTFSMLLLLLITTLVFYGQNRFTHVMLELLYIPLIGLGIEERLRLRA